MSRPSLPLDLISAPGTILTPGLGSITFPTKTNCVPAVNTSEFYSENASLKLNPITANASVSAMSGEVFSMSFDNVSSVDIPIYNHEAGEICVDIYASIRKTIADNTGYTFRLYTQFLQAGWNLVHFQKSKHYKNGAPAASDVYKVVEFTINPFNSACTPNISIDPLIINRETEARCVVCFDDELISQYVNAKPIIQRLEAEYGISIHPEMMLRGDNIGNGSAFMSDAQILELANLGWGAGNHTFNHLNLTTLTLAQATEQFTKNNAFLKSIGLQNIVAGAYPDGYFNATARAAAKAAGLEYALTILNTTRNVSPYLNKYAMGRRVIDLNTVLADVYDDIEAAKKYGRTFILLFHSIVDIATLAGETTKVVFEKILRKVADAGIPMVNMFELHQQRKNPRFIVGR